MTWGAIAGAAISVGGAILSKPKAAKAAEYTPVDLQAEQKKAIQGNLDNEGDIEALLARSNQFQQSQATDLMEQAIPGWSSLQKQLTSTSADLLTNPYDLPEDVQANLTRQAAERGISTGRVGQAGQFSLLRDLGVNSLQYGQSRIAQGQSLASTLANLAPKVNPMSPLSFYVTPAMSAQNQTTNNMQQQAIQQGANNANAAASNAYNQNLWDSIAQAAAMGVSAYGEYAKNKVPTVDVPTVTVPQDTPYVRGPNDPTTPGFYQISN